MTKSDPRAEPISRTTLPGQVTERLRDGILAGSYAQGEQLNEVELARRFGVSRGPLREAMQRLIQDGLLETRPHRGVFVPELTDEDLAGARIVRGRSHALTSVHTPTPNTACLGTEPLACVKMNCRILIGAQTR